MMNTRQSRKYGDLSFTRRSIYIFENVRIDGLYLNCSRINFPDDPLIVDTVKLSRAEKADILGDAIMGDIIAS